MMAVSIASLTLKRLIDRHDRLQEHVRADRQRTSTIKELISIAAKISCILL
ncbi:hypothetical protein [Bradyrhizobium sp. USDA 4504]